MSNKDPLSESKIEIQLDPDILKGTFSNVTNIGHTQEEFLVDFLFVQQHPTPFGKLVSRIVITPGHARRLLSALQENLKKYEENFGKPDMINNTPGSQTIQ